MIKITRKDVAPELWEKLLSRSRLGNADVIEVEVVGVTVLPKSESQTRSFRVTADERSREDD
jgi:hypothetical protein